MDKQTRDIICVKKVVSQRREFAALQIDGVSGASMRSLSLPFNTPYLQLFLLDAMFVYAIWVILLIRVGVCW